jgi:diguanylate cyclase (GGDEF)-like protein
LSEQHAIAIQPEADIFQPANMPQQLRILVVDDEDLDRVALRRMLEKSGLNVTLREAESAAEAFETISREQFDCVLLDYHLPDLDGDGIFEYIETTYEEKAPAVVFVSGENNEGLARELLQNGAVDFIDKDDLSAVGLKRAILFAMARRIRQRQLREVSQFDGLTSLPGRKLCYEMLEDAIEQSSKSSRSGVFIIFEIDQFKVLTERYGPAFAESLLQAITARLRTTVRGADKIGRLAEDQFAVIGQELLALSGTEVFANKINSALSLPYDLGETGLFVRFNAGAALFPNDGRTAAEVIKAAEIALTSSATSSDGKTIYFNAKLGKDQDRHRELQADIGRSLSRNQMMLHYQPVIDCRNGTLASVETLLRWRHHVYGIVAPGEFLPIAEACGQLSPIGEWVVQQTTQAAAHWAKTLERPAPCTINVGYSQLLSGGFSEALGLEIRRNNLAPSLVGIEFSANILQRVDQTIENELRAIHGLGVRLILDNFGVASASIAGIARLPLHTIKIARQLVLNLTADPSAERTVRAIAAMASTLGISTTAVGVENEEQLKILRDIGLEGVQGHLLGTPQSREAFAGWLRKQPAMRKRLFTDGTANDDEPNPEGDGDQAA